RGVAEVSLYVLREAQGQQIGTRLLFAAVEASEAAGIWSLLSNIFADNEPSLAVHRRCGFRLVGRRERIAQDGAGSWKDMAMMERRSAVTGL
ncbi:MAG: GNAT family N-acetyltransferase, partial [Oscillospiraceae bacterium]